jgi:predicted kinase
MASPPLCHMLIGPPGSGKTTLARHLHQLIPQSCVVSTDQIRQHLYGDPIIQGPWPQIEAVVEAQARQVIHQGQTLIYDATNTKPLWRQALLQRLAPLQTSWVGWPLTTPLATCLEWNRQRSRAVDPAVIAAMHQDLRQFPPQADEGFIALYPLDPRQGLEAVEAQLQSLVKVLQLGRLLTDPPGPQGVGPGSGGLPP